VKRDLSPFLWGASTAAYQTEGGNTNSDWWQLERSGFAMVTEPSGDACDSYHRWAEDMDLLAGAGFTDYRFSVEWARIEPTPGVVSRAQLDHYRRMVDGALARGLRPMLTLHHFTNPRWFAEAGGWSAPDAGDVFTRYVDALEPLLDHGVEHVCTINEPNIVAVLGTLLRESADAPSVRGVAPDADTTAGLLAAHAKAVALLREKHPSVKCGWSVAVGPVHPVPGAEAAAAKYLRDRQDVFIEASASDDWIGVQTYSRTRVGSQDGRVTVVDPPDDVERTLTGWEYYPQALGEAVHYVAALVPKVPIIVTENGIATSDDARRIDYTKTALASLREAIDDGIDVRGYYHWSLLDNYEWGSYTPTFGLVAVDRTTFRRTPKPSLNWLGAIRLIPPLTG
jgi:beta-glucosidase